MVLSDGVGIGAVKGEVGASLTPGTEPEGVTWLL